MTAKGEDLYYDTGNLTQIKKRLNELFSGVDAEDAYSGVVDYPISTKPTTPPAGKMAPDKTIVLTLTRPMTRIQLLNVAYNSDEVQGQCRLHCTLDKAVGSGQTYQIYDALTRTAHGDQTDSQLMDNPTGQNTFSPYAYFFMNETTPDSEPVSLTVKVESGGKEYGIKAGEGGEKSNAGKGDEVGKPIEIPQVVKNQKITVQNTGGGTLKLYAIPSSKDNKSNKRYSSFN